MQLHPYQVDNVMRALAEPLPRRWIFANEMGLGKTAEAINATKVMWAQEFARQSITHYYPQVLIVCPAIVRQNWLRELDLWWPDHPPAAAITVGRTRQSGLSKLAKAERDAAYAAPIQIVSYALIEEIDNELPWSYIILDEAHRLKDPKTAWSQAVRDLLTEHPQATAWALTATLMPNVPQDAHNILDILWPARFGKRWKFLQRYTNGTQGEYGWHFEGVNEANVNELRTRLGAVSSRTVKSDVAHLLPPFDVVTLRVPRVSAVPRIQDLEWGTFRAHEERVASELLKAGYEKLPHVLEWAQDALAAAQRVSILTHHRDLAEAIAVALRAKGVPVTHIDGSIAPLKRNLLLDEAAQAPYGAVVATMESVGIGIDMTFTPQALFAELHYRPETMIQALGRFSRLSGKVQAACTLLVIEGTLDEIIASRLEEKVTAINSAIKAGQTEAQLHDKLAAPGGDWLEELRSAAATMVVDDGYLA